MPTVSHPLQTRIASLDPVFIFLVAWWCSGTQESKPRATRTPSPANTERELRPSPPTSTVPATPTRFQAPEVCHDLLYRFPTLAHAAEASTRRNRAGQHALLHIRRARGPHCNLETWFRGLDWEMNMNSRTQISELWKCVEIRRKVRKMQI